MTDDTDDMSPNRQQADHGSRLFHVGEGEASAIPPSVLVVDDDPVMLEMGRRILESDFEVFTAGLAQEALDRLDRSPIGVLVSDLKMPGVDGIELVQEAGRRHPDIVCIMISGSPTLDADVRAHIPGIHRTVQKPIDPAEFCEIVAHAADVWALRLRNRILSVENSELRRSTSPALPSAARLSPPSRLRESVAQYERNRIAETVAACHGNKSAAARRLGLTYRGLLLKMQRIGMVPSSSRPDLGPNVK